MNRYSGVARSSGGELVVATVGVVFSSNKFFTSDRSVPVGTFAILQLPNSNTVIFENSSSDRHFCHNRLLLSNSQSQLQHGPEETPLSSLRFPLYFFSLSFFQYPFPIAILPEAAGPPAWGASLLLSFRRPPLLVRSPFPFHFSFFAFTRVSFASFFWRRFCLFLFCFRSFVTFHFLVSGPCCHFHD